MTRTTRRRNDMGIIAAVELPLGLLLLVPAAIVALTAATWFERHAAARAAADEAARAVVTADTWAQGTTQAQQAVAQAATNYDLDPADLSLHLEGTLARGATVTATVTVTMPAADIPLLGPVGTTARTVTHTEIVDRYRSLPT